MQLDLVDGVFVPNLVPPAHQSQTSKKIRVAAFIASLRLPVAAIEPPTVAYAPPILFIGGVGVENGFKCWCGENCFAPSF